MIKKIFINAISLLSLSRLLLAEEQNPASQPDYQNEINMIVDTRRHFQPSQEMLDQADSYLKEYCLELKACKSAEETCQKFQTITNRFLDRLHKLFEEKLFDSEDQQIQFIQEYLDTHYDTLTTTYSAVGIIKPQPDIQP